MSRQMILAYLALAAALLALPQFVAVVPIGALPFVACAAGVINLVLRWLDGALGPNVLTVAGVITLAVGILSVPELLALIPITYMPVITVLSSVLTLIARYVVGQNPSDPAAPVGALFRVQA